MLGVGLGVEVVAVGLGNEILVAFFGVGIDRRHQSVQRRTADRAGRIAAVQTGVVGGVDLQILIGEILFTGAGGVTEIDKKFAFDCSRNAYAKGCRRGSTY